MHLTEHEIREAMGMQLASILYRQEALLRCNEALKFMQDDKVKKEFRTMAEEDERNYLLLKTVMGNFGNRLEPRPSAINLAHTLEATVKSSESLPIEKLAAYALLKHEQLMSTQVLQKAVQVAKPDIKAAFAMFDGIYTSFGSQSGELREAMERSGVEWMTGHEPVSGIFDFARDALSAVTGAILSKIAKPADQMSIIDVLKTDHDKVKVLFQEIDSAKNQEQAEDLFQQLKADLTAHSIAEEEEVYESFRNREEMKTNIIESKADHEDLRGMLDEVSDAIQDKEQFADKVSDLHNLFNLHVDREEKQLFDFIKRNMSEDELVHLSRKFLVRKEEIQKNMGVDEIVSSAAKGDSSRSRMASNP